MRKLATGTMIALILSAPLAIAQDYPAPGAAGREDDIAADRTAIDTEIDADASPDTAEAGVTEQRPDNSASETRAGGKSPARLETTTAAVITDTLVSGEKMELTVRFKVNSDQIKGVAHKQILEIANALKGADLAGMRVGVQGHTDGDGDADYNLDLSYRRSVTVVRMLIDQYNIEPSRLEVSGYGESRPIASNETDEGKALNRRVTLVGLDAPEEEAQ